MMFAYRAVADRLVRLGPSDPLEDALWIDLYRPIPEQIARVAALGIEVPSLADMEEIEISNRLYRDQGMEFITVVLPGLSETREATSGPVTFILMPGRLVTVRHHAPRPFETYPDRASRAAAGLGSPERIFLGLVEDIIGRLADLLEGAGRALDEVARAVYNKAGHSDEALQHALQQVGRQGELLGRVQLSLLTLERGLSFVGQTAGERPGTEGLRPLIKGLMRDIQALEVHGEFLSTRVALASDATLGMVNLAQNATVRIVSTVAVLFLPPTLIASVYGMNFVHMPELAMGWGYPLALGLMLASALGTYLFFKWKRWL